MNAMFHPSLSLTVEPDGEFTLHAVTLTPNNCYSAGRAEAAPPPTVRVTKETFPVVLHIAHRTGLCGQIVTPVRHQLGNLNLEGKLTLLAFAMVDGQIVGSTSIPVHGTVLPHPKPVQTADWQAWVNAMPPGPKSFHVTGTVIAPTPGWVASLKVASPQGINPRDLILDLVVTKKPGIWPQHVTPIHVSYEQHPYDGNYETVLVREPDGDADQIKVITAF